MKKVLVIDDEEPFRLVVHAYLRKHGYTTLGARNGDEGVKLALVEVPDLVLSDVKMNGLDGFDVLRKLRSQPETAFIPVILMTGFPNDYDVRASLEQAADDFLVKPFDATALVAAVRARLKRQDTAPVDAKEQLELPFRPAAT